MSKSVRFFPYFQANVFACHPIIDTDRRCETPGSEILLFIIIFVAKILAHYQLTEL